MDSVLIDDLRVSAIVGIHAWEREVPQVLLVSLEMMFDISTAAASGDIRDALDYAAVAARVSEFIRDGRFHLLETMAEQTASMLLSEFSIPWLRLAIKKTQVMANTRAVGVTIERGNKITGKDNA